MSGPRFDIVRHFADPEEGAPQVTVNTVALLIVGFILDSSCAGGALDLDPVPMAVGGKGP